MLKPLGVPWGEVLAPLRAAMMLRPSILARHSKGLLIGAPHPAAAHQFAVRAVRAPLARQGAIPCLWRGIVADGQAVEWAAERADERHSAAPAPRCAVAALARVALAPADGTDERFAVHVPSLRQAHYAGGAGRVLAGVGVIAAAVSARVQRIRTCRSTCAQRGRFKGDKAPARCFIGVKV